MEADLGREDADCECSGHGVVNAERPNGTEVEVECDECYGDGRLDCDECKGSGRIYGESWDEGTCEEWILNYVSDEARKALTFSKFYYDGSVDSEMTLTLPVANAEYMVEYMEAFSALSDKIGNGLETGGAGLHIAVIPKETNGRYPAPANTLPADKFNNFRTEVTKLMPALFLLASADNNSRGLGYRTPQISSSEKYSAINGCNRSTLEYRIFETCYDKPEMVKEYVEVIAKTLKFYHDPSLKVETIGKTFNIVDGRGVDRFYKSPGAIKILRKQLQYIKPEGKTVAQLMKERDVDNITELRKTLSSQSAKLRKQWYAEKKRIETVKKQPLTPEQERYKRDLLQDSYSSYSEEMADNIARGLRQQQQSLVDYLNSNLYGNGRSEYTISV